jgi:Asp-tRNA(Asn)/Glu-tRNA(Gln) amidotransferase A subunit family amidase
MDEKAVSEPCHHALQAFYDRYQGLEHLNAIISTCPPEIAFSLAKQLDDERKQERLRSKLHGVPIVLKVSSSGIVIACDC